MDKTRLSELDFKKWYRIQRISAVNLPYGKAGVYIIRDTTIPGDEGSGIIYIGRSRNLLRKILGAYIGGLGGKASRNVHKKLFKEGYIERTEISWKATDKAKREQKSLLAEYQKDYGELPVWNAKGKAKPVKKTGEKKAS